jgi:dTMP kinase
LAHKGKFFVFEGIDGSGKTTLIKKLEEKFAQMEFPLHTTLEPTKNHIGSLLRQILTHEIKTNEQTIAALFLADRLDHIHHPEYGMKQFVEKGTHVICDRYYLSSFAYHVPHVSLDWVMMANGLASDILTPDVTFFIDISVDTSLHRIANSRTTVDLFESKERITMVRENYHAAIQKTKERDNIIVIDGEAAPSLVFDKVWSVIKKII